MNTFATWITVISTILGSLITFIATKGVDAYLRVRKDQRDADSERRTAALAEQHHQEDRVETKQEEQISDLKTQVATLITDLKVVQKENAAQAAAFMADQKAMQKEHTECVRQFAAVEAKYELLSKQYEAAIKEIDSLRQWRHEVANTLHTEVLKKAVSEVGAHTPLSPESG
jgi:predicted RNase H-like nuclease (RuvC/YqgF family)